MRLFRLASDLPAAERLINACGYHRRDPELAAAKQAILGKTVREENLLRLARAAEVQLLQKLGVKGSLLRSLPLTDGDEKSEKVNEFEKLVEDVNGHALTLQIVGGFLARAFHGDIRQRDRVKFEKADTKIQGGHAFRAMDAYVHWLELEATGKTERKNSVSSFSFVQRVSVLLPF